MEMSTIIIVLGVLYFGAHLLSYLFERSKIPDVLILMIIGIIVGPVLKIVLPSHFGAIGPVITSIALIIILFESGMNLDLEIISKSMRSTLALTLITFIGTSLIVMAIMHWILFFPLTTSITTGFILGGTSAAVVIPLVGALKMDKKAGTVLILESAFTDVLCIVFTIGFLQGTASGDVSAGKISGGILASLAFAALIGIFCGFLWLAFLDKIRKFPNTQFTTFAYIFIMYGVTELLGYSGAISCLAFGIILGNHEHINLRRIGIKRKIAFAVITDVEKKLYSEMVFLLKTFFFVYLGISIPFSNMKVIFIALLIIVILYAFRILATRVFFDRKASWIDSSMVSIMIPKGLAAAVLAGLPVQYGLENGKDIQDITYMVILLSIFATSVMVPLIQGTPLGRVFKVLFDKKIVDHKPQKEIKSA